MRLKAIFLIAAFVFVAFGLRIATYAQRNLSSLNTRPAIVCVTKAHTKDSIVHKGPGRTLRNPLKSLKISLLPKKEPESVHNDSSASFTPESHLLSSIFLRGLRRPPRA